jgi:hypothetical protein
VAGVHSRLEHGKGVPLWHYWTVGPGRARWATWRELRAALASEIDDMTPGALDGLARNIYRKATGHEPPHPGRGGKGKKRS